MKLVQLLLQNGADIDQIIDEEKNHSILMMFCSVKYKLLKRELEINLSMIKFLLENGANKYLKSAKNKDCY